MKERLESFNDMIARLFPDKDKKVRTVTMQVTDGCNLRCTYCLDGGTPVAMADGTARPIREIREGDTVLGFDETGLHDRVYPVTVTKTFRHRDRLLSIRLRSGRELRITANHRVLAALGTDMDFQPAGCLAPGQRIYAYVPGGPFEGDTIVSLAPLAGETEVFNLETESGTYIAGGLGVHNCYQINKGQHFMDFGLAKRFINLLLAGENPYINFSNTSGIILDFIGGEPLLAIGLIRQITEYTLDKMVREKHPWLERFRVSLCSNGTLYFQPEVQKYFQEFSPWISFSISIDGNRQLHDACRVFPDGTGSYDMAAGAALHYMKHYGAMGTKMTLAPGNIAYTADAIWNLLNLGYEDVFANCVYEEGWTKEHATTLYNQLKILGDALLRTGRCDTVYISIFDEDEFRPMNTDEPDDDRNWCGGNGDMLAVDWKGDLYPCLRYMESSLGTDVPPIIIGTVDGGLEATPDQKQWVQCLQCMTRTSQSTAECITCPIARGCSWCSAYNFQYFGKLNVRATFICDMHKARALGNCYFWNRYYRQKGESKRMPCNVPREWATEIIPEAEYDMLLELAGP